MFLRELVGVVSDYALRLTKYNSQVCYVGSLRSFLKRFDHAELDVYAEAASQIAD